METNVISLKQVEAKILVLRGQNVLLDNAVAELYGVETKRVNEAIANNPEKFPDGYVITLDKPEWDNLKTKISTSSLRSKISTLNSSEQGRHTKYPPKAFTEKGLYMLATILKSPQATATTIAIVETFAKMRELNRTIAKISGTADKSAQTELMQKSGDIMAELLEDGLHVSETETTFEINLAMMKFKHTIKQTSQKNNRQKQK
jgi:phage regulator Rha-like protein